MRIPLGICLTALLVSVASAQLKPTPLTGTWSLTEVKTTGPKARTISNAPGLLLFTGNHYSRLYIASDQPREPLKDQSKATAAELLAVWGPVIVSSGTYEISGNTLTFQPIVAKNPEVMAPGAIGVYSFKLEGKQLTMTEVRNVNGPITNPPTMTYTRVE